MNKFRIPEYNSKIDHYEQELFLIKKQHARVSLLRLAVFIAFFLTWFWLFIKHQQLGASLGISLLVVFLWLLKKHKKLEDEKHYLENILNVNKNEKVCCEGKFDQFDAGNEFVDINHAYSYDIDLFGIGSLFQYLNRTITIPGKILLAEWLSNTPLNKKTIKENQEAVKELSQDLEFRQSFLTIGQLYESKEDETKTIHTWLNLKPFFKKQGFIIALLYILPLINLVLLAGMIAGIFDWALITYIIIFNLGIVSTRIKSFNTYYSHLSSSHGNLKKMAHLLNLINDHDVKSAKLKRLRNLLYKNEKSANEQIHKLTKLLDALDNRNNLLMGFILNALLLWDWQCVVRIEKWQKNHQIDFENWLETIANYDAIISLANLNYNNPDFTFAELSDQPFEFTAKEIGHPLLDSEVRICNDFDISEKQRYAIVTGANMAGKSTFLRTIATNLVLAGAGASVCAKELRFTPLPLFSSMRTEDSLMKNESYFFAELKRLQRITKELEKGKKLFIILDEILRGTNSEDKRKGSIGFVKKITEQMAHGLVATHDLELARLAEQQPNVFKALCFEVAIDNNKLNFDYMLQPGVTQNMNASFLMKQMGIIDE